jgi:DNA-binding protein H-NS
MRVRGVNLDSMSDEEFWVLHEEMTAEVKRRLLRQKARIEDRLRKIEKASDLTKQPGEARVRRRPPPKYQNPKSPHETWAGRGKQPRWVKLHLEAGKKLNDLLIASPEKRRRTR